MDVQIFKIRSEINVNLIAIWIFGPVNIFLPMARYLGIGGFVKNLNDGSVCLEAEAEEKSLNDFILWCRKGPDFARVEKVETKEIPVKNESRFYIRD